MGYSGPCEGGNDHTGDRMSANIASLAVRMMITDILDNGVSSSSSWSSGGSRPLFCAQLAFSGSTSIFRDEKDADEQWKTLFSSSARVSWSGSRDDSSKALPKVHKIPSQNTFVEVNLEAAG